MNETPAMIPLRFFQALQRQDYEQAWDYLSRQSQNMIVQILAKSWKAHSPQELEADFAQGLGVAQSYWKAFREQIQLDTWLQQSYRAFGVSGDEVMVKASPSGVILLVIREAQHWKFGYMETFLETK